MSLPTPHALGVRRRSVGAVDAHGVPAITFAAATTWLVHAVAPGANPDLHLPNRDATAIEWTVYAPADASAPGPLDRVVLGGVEYAVEGTPQDWTQGPWAHPTAGVVVELRRVEG